ncbi:hypothetical protein AOLI_G00083730 [Acnodon oligacanthus]
MVGLATVALTGSPGSIPAPAVLRSIRDSPPETHPSPHLSMPGNSSGSALTRTAGIPSSINILLLMESVGTEREREVRREKGERGATA